MMTTLDRSTTRPPGQMGHEGRWAGRPDRLRWAAVVPPPAHYGGTMAHAELTAEASPQGVTFKDHTADVIMEATGPTLDSCLARAGAGLFAVFAPPPSSEALIPYEIRVEGRRLRPEDEPAGPSVKAVTRHQLRLGPGGEGWLAQVVLDV